jgi:hypothetical protein
MSEMITRRMTDQELEEEIIQELRISSPLQTAYIEYERISQIWINFLASDDDSDNSQRDVYTKIAQYIRSIPWENDIRPIRGFFTNEIDETKLTPVEAEILKSCNLIENMDNIGSIFDELYQKFLNTLLARIYLKQKMEKYSILQ